MTRPIPPELLARIDAHERWLETTKREGQEFAQGNMDLRDLDLSGRHLGMSILPDARLDRAVLRGTSLSDSNLRGASFVEAVMDCASLVETDAGKANLSGASLREVRGVCLELQEANLQSADLTSGNFWCADFSKANLEYTNLSYVNLRQTYFYEACMARATLTGASLRDAQLAGAVGLEQAEVSWIDIGEENVPQRLEGETARCWLLQEAAKPLPEWWKS